MADLLNNISITSFVLATLFIVLTIVLWFVFKIPGVIGDLSGRNVRKSIAKMRQHNVETGNKAYRTSQNNIARGKLTETMEGLVNSGNVEETGLLKENTAKKHEVEATGLLIDDTTELLQHSAETDSLENQSFEIDRPPSSIVIHMIEEVMMIHTNETI